MSSTAKLFFEKHNLKLICYGGGNWGWDSLLEGRFV
jgi:hypothetical protein